MSRAINTEYYYLNINNTNNFSNIVGDLNKTLMYSFWFKINQNPTSEIFIFKTGFDNTFGSDNTINIWIGIMVMG